MAVHLNLFPKEVQDNRCYQYLMEKWEKEKQDTFDWDYLIGRFGIERVKPIMDAEFLVKQRGEKVRLSFAVLGTVPNLAVRHVNREILTFVDLLLKFPKTCTLVRLRTVLTYLINFKILQTFTLPASAITCVALDNDTSDQQIDQIMCLSDYLEKRFVYRVDVMDGATEASRAVGLSV